MPRPARIDRALLEAALQGLQQRLADVNQNIAAVKRMLRPGTRAAAPAAKNTARPRRKMSATARKRIAEAQRRRWAEFRAKSAGKTRGRAGRKSAKQAAGAPE